MKKQIILITLSVLTVNCLKAQTLNQDADGNSTIIYQGSNVSFDLTKTNLSFSYTNLGLLSTKADVSKKFRPVWGVNINGKNSDGIADLFKRGDFQPEAGLGGFIGIKYRFDEKPQTLSNLEQQKEPLVIEKIQVNNKLEELKAKTDQSSKEEIEQLTKRKKELEKKIQDIQDKREEINKTRTRKLALFYLRGGRNATSFKLAKDNPDTTGFTKTFENKNFEGGFLGVGINYEYGRWLLGLGIDYEYTNNFDDLNKSTYTLTTKEIKGNQTLESHKEITAFSGNFQTYQRTNLNMDFIMFSKLDEDNRNYIAWNLYIRHKISHTTSITPTYTNIGAGAYFFNKSNKFLGGVYIEAPDFFQDVERTKDAPNFREIQNRLTFGVVAKFNFGSVVGPSFN